MQTIIAGLVSFTSVSRSHRSISFLAKSGGVGSSGRRPGQTSKVSCIVCFKTVDPAVVNLRRFERLAGLMGLDNELVVREVASLPSTG